jgi:mevalonate pyrophosphate decarboxylase
MASPRKKMAAALAAVNLYLQQEEAQMAQEQQASLKQPESFQFSQWGQSGRQEMMAMRKLIQLRAFTRF